MDKTRYVTIVTVTTPQYSEVNDLATVDDATKKGLKCVERIPSINTILSHVGILKNLELDKEVKPFYVYKEKFSCNVRSEIVEGILSEADKANTVNKLLTRQNLETILTSYSDTNIEEGYTELNFLLAVLLKAYIKANKPGDYIIIKEN